MINKFNYFKYKTFLTAPRPPPPTTKWQRPMTVEKKHLQIVTKG